MMLATHEDFLARWEGFQDEKLPLADFTSVIHSAVYLVTDLAQNLPFLKKEKEREKKTYSKETLLFTYLLREKMRASRSLLSLFPCCT